MAGQRIPRRGIHPEPITHGIAGLDDIRIERTVLYYGNQKGSRGIRGSKELNTAKVFARDSLFHCHTFLPRYWGQIDKEQEILTQKEGFGKIHIPFLCFWLDIAKICV